MSKTPESSSSGIRRPKPRKATMTSRSQFLLGRKLLLNASGTSSLQERAKVSHARIWNPQEIKKQFTREYMDEQLARADRQNHWLWLTLYSAGGGNS